MTARNLVSISDKSHLKFAATALQLTKTSKLHCQIDKKIRQRRSTKFNCKYFVVN